ncbi:hypothetical protein LS68_000115 [Helicobacter sp. MIT 05-5293]|uniref:metallophosphoesterase n=1 Tax=Helicobacter sp. MIT 05-5293 TaxID=1548149 RepID=UPI00068A30E6|nr:metallophosphoesterase [Helicobacter sp. MIT 05-5293]TLD81487.1 hypothetical protein LS68_000115 [Helicobacter sp. MIT 05-5293]
MTLKYSILLILFLAIVVSALYVPLKERFYTIESLSSPDKANPIHIALLSDLHSGKLYLPTLFAKLEEALKENRLDMIVMSGDMIDDDEPFDGARVFFERLNAPPFDRLPKFYVSGNHEFWSGEILSFKAFVREHQTFVLDSASPCVYLNLKGREILIAGVDDPYSVKYDTQGIFIQKNYPKNWQDEWINTFQNTFKGDFDCTIRSDLPLWLESLQSHSSSQPYKILLSHRPEFVSLYTQSPFSLVLSGHTHGGQVRIPFLINGLYAPNQGIFPQFAGGKYEIGKDELGKAKHLIVSRGLSFNPILPRIYNPPEIVWIKI